MLFARDQQQGCLSSELQAAMQVALNSMSRDTSTSTQSETDAITEETPCELHVPFGYKGKTIMVATGRAILGQTLHNRDIPPEYVIITVVDILPVHEDDEIECPIPEAGIETCLLYTSPSPRD